MRRILVVDDDPNNRVAIGLRLKQCGFRGSITDGGASGLAALNDAHLRPDDRRYIRAAYARLRIDQDTPSPRADRAADCDLRGRLCQPRFAGAGFLRMALELGATRCLRKPSTPGALLAVVNECLAEARSRFNDAVRSNQQRATSIAATVRRSIVRRRCSHYCRSGIWHPLPRYGDSLAVWPSVTAYLP
jgi:CheY-like chemotaxis protein